VGNELEIGGRRGHLFPEKTGRGGREMFLALSSREASFREFISTNAIPTYTEGKGTLRMPSSETFSN